MQTILLIGAGRSSTVLIQYLLKHAMENDWMIIVGDVSEELAKSKIANHQRGKGIRFDIQDEQQRNHEISKADCVISMLPAHMHFPVAVQCVREKKNLVTASYISAEMQQLDDEAKQQGVLLMNECGLDPGIDHMSAMKIIDAAHHAGEEIISFKSYTGGLVAPESNDNPWGYKFSWNPRNVILAGQGTAKYIEANQYRYIPYNRLFVQTEEIRVDGFASFDGYANRDSLGYRKLYGLEKIPTMLRGTLRQKGFCKAWNVFVQLGLTDDSYVVEDSANLTYRQLVDAFLPNQDKANTELRLASFINEDLNSEVMKKIIWTGILNDEPIGLLRATPAQILQHLLEQKWKLKEGDKDMIVMQHQFVVRAKNASEKKITSSLIVKGDDALKTAMAKTVGLPLAILAKLILKKQLKLTGVHVPVQKEIYEPVLRELEESGIVFNEVAGSA
jgi:saccharopine dehydrogenase-like NADP-dependent oxidoreductase